MSTNRARNRNDRRPGALRRLRSRGFRPLAATGLGLAALLAACGGTSTDSGLETNEDVTVGPAIDDAAAEQRIEELVEVLRANGMESFASVIEQVDVVELADTEDFTVLGPSDEAFFAIGADETAELLGDPAQLTALVRNHIVPGRVEGADLRSASSLTTGSGTTLAVRSDGESVTVGSAELLRSDISAGAAIVHVVDKVMLP